MDKLALKLAMSFSWIITMMTFNNYGGNPVHYGVAIVGGIVIALFFCSGYEKVKKEETGWEKTAKTLLVFIMAALTVFIMYVRYEAVRDVRVEIAQEVSAYEGEELLGTIEDCLSEEEMYHTVWIFPETLKQDCRKTIGLEAGEEAEMLPDTLKGTSEEVQREEGGSEE